MDFAWDEIQPFAASGEDTRSFASFQRTQPVAGLGSLQRTQPVAGLGSL